MAGAIALEHDRTRLTLLLKQVIGIGIILACQPHEENAIDCADNDEPD
jgi:hypothetical protein